MTYHFFFERKKLILLVLLLVLAGVVLFLTGLLIGMNLGPAGAAPSLDPKAPSAAWSGADSSRAPASEASDSSSDSSIEPEHGAGNGPSGRVDESADSPPDRREAGGENTSAAPDASELERDRVTKRPEAREAQGEPEVFELQLSLVRSAAEAEREVERWRRIGFSPYVVAVSSVGGERRFTVRIGPFASREKALEEQRRLAQGEGHQSVLRFRRAAYGPIPESAISPS